MANADAQLGQLLETSLQVEYSQGAASGVAFAYSTGWRRIPFVLVSQWMDNRVRYEREGHPPQDLPDGDAVVLPAGMYHRISVLGDAIYSRWAHLRFTLFGSVDLLSLLDTPLILTRPLSEQAGDLCEALSRLVNSTDIPILTVTIRKHALCMRLLELIIEQAPLKPEGITLLTHITRVAPVLRHLDAHLADDMTRDDLAALLNLSAPQFHTVFKGAMGISPMEYLKRQRIHRAQELLMQTDLPISTIAMQVGFRDPFHFSRQFNAACGASPRLYRQQLRLSFLTPPSGD